VECRLGSEASLDAVGHFWLSPAGFQVAYRLLAGAGPAGAAVQYSSDEPAAERLADYRYHALADCPASWLMNLIRANGSSPSW